MNYNGRKFKVKSNSDSGELSTDLIFLYEQIDNILHSTYADKQVIQGHLLGIVDANGKIEMRYHQINQDGELMTGTCISTPEVMENGKIRLHESWQWTSGDQSKGNSILEEV